MTQSILLSQTPPKPFLAELRRAMLITSLAYPLSQLTTLSRDGIAGMVVTIEGEEAEGAANMLLCLGEEGGLWE